MMHFPYISNRKSFDEAARLIAEFGDSALLHAAERADASRERGNHIHFCEWRQIERLILIMSIEQPLGTIH